MSTILITGGAGFIGSHLSEALLARGHRVLVLDDLSSGNITNLSALRSNPNLEFYPDAVSSRGITAELVDRADVIYHLAATVGVFNIIENPVGTIANNIGGTEELLKLAAKKKKRVLLASTSEVYGKTTAVPFREDGDLVLGPTSRARWSYAASKIIDEFLALAYWREYRVPAVVVRLFNTIGPRQIGRYGMVVPRLLTQAISGKNLTVYGTGKQSRCFCYVSDVVNWLMLLASSDSVAGEVFNLGNPEEVTIEELARRIIRITGANVGIDYLPYEKVYDAGFEDMERRVPDIGKITALTGYRPQVRLDDALCATRDWLIEETGRHKPFAAALPS
jgi:UDP-glucose 4-epimerase